MKKRNSEIQWLFPVLAIAFFTVPSHLLSQPKKGMYGLTTTISKGFVDSQNIANNAGALNIGISYLPSDQINLKGEIGFYSQKDTSGAKNSEFTFTGHLWYYLQTNESVSTFLGTSIGVGSANLASGDAITLLNLSGFFGAEYWFSPHFSCFGHIGVVYSSYTIVSKPASDIFTSATTGLTWYF